MHEEMDKGEKKVRHNMRGDVKMFKIHCSVN